MDFTRERKLTFMNVFILIFRNTVKSLQIMLNEFILLKNYTFTITGSAFSQARRKLKYTAFKELNENIVSLYYQDQITKKLFDFRIIGCDASFVTLPKNEKIKEFFGVRMIKNQTGNDFGVYSRGIFQTFYDVLNNICIESTLEPGNMYEAELATRYLDKFSSTDLLIFDRGYTAYPFLANLFNLNLNYIIRASKASFSEVRNMFKMENQCSKIVDLKVPAKHAKRIRELGLPDVIKVKLVKVVLDSGEPEVLITSLIEQNSITEEDFKILYGLRWGVETFYSKVKGRLELENFTGKNIESIKQDFWSTILISNLETILTEDDQQTLDNIDKNKHQKVINKAVSFNSIKNMAFEIFDTENNKDKVFDKLSKLFLMNTVTKRSGREIPRVKISDIRSLNYQKRIKKRIF